MNKYLLYFLITIIFASIMIWIITPPAIKVDFAKVQYGLYQEYIEHESKTRAIKIYSISAPVAGTLLRITLNEGDTVSLNDILAIIEPESPPLLNIKTQKELMQELIATESLLKAETEQVAQAQIEFNFSASEYERKKLLITKNYIPKSDFEKTETNYLSRKTELRAAQYRLHRLEHELEKIKISLSEIQTNNQNHVTNVKIFSPISGKILRIYEKSKTPISAGSPILELADLSKLEIVADILSVDAATIPEHAKVLIKTNGVSFDLTGVVRTIEPQAHTKVSILGVEEQRIYVIIDLTSPYELWKKLGNEYEVDLKIITFEDPQALIVPMGAVFRDEQDWAVFVLKNKKAFKQKISMVRHNSDYAMIDHGLIAGQQVILYPGNLIEHNMRLK